MENIKNYNPREGISTLGEDNFLCSNFTVCKAVSDSIRTSLGPHGMDKVIISNQEILITNDGATILENARFQHPAAKMLVNISKSQDQEIGDGTTTVVVLTGSILGTCLNLLKKGFQKILLAEELWKILKKIEQILIRLSFPVDIGNMEKLYDAAFSSLESKVVSAHSYVLAPIAVNAILRITDINSTTGINLNDIKIIKKIGGVVEQTELLEGFGLNYPAVKSYGGPIKMKKAQIALIQFCLSRPSTDIENTVIIENYLSMDKILKEEKEYVTGLCRKIKSSGCNVLLVQKSILRESLSPLSLQILSQMKIMVIQDIDRDDIAFISKSLGCTPIIDIEAFAFDKFGKAEIVEEKSFFLEKMIEFKGIQFTRKKTATILLRASNNLLLEEADRSLHDALCVIRSIIRRRFIITGGGSVEMEISIHLKQYSKGISGLGSLCMFAIANTMEIIPFTLAENAGLEPLQMMSMLRAFHTKGEKTFGINIRKGAISDMFEENIISPLLVTTSAINLAFEFVIQMLKIDDIILAR